MTTLGDHFSLDGCASNNRCADVHVVAIGDQQNAVKSHGFASSDFQFFDLQVFTFSDLVLLTAGNDYCVHGISPIILLTQLFIRRGIGWHGCMGLERPKCNCVRQVLPRKFRVRDCTQASRVTQEAVHRALTGPGGGPSMPRNPSGATVADATPSFLPRGGGRF